MKLDKCMVTDSVTGGKRRIRWTQTMKWDKCMVTDSVTGG